MISESNYCLDKSSEVIDYKNFWLLEFTALLLGVMMTCFSHMVRLTNKKLHC